MELTEHESIFCQALAITFLLEELDRTDFLNTDYYNENVEFSANNDNVKKILKASGIGNPATLQMFLYVLFVMPKEIFSDLGEGKITSWENEFKRNINSYSITVTTSYPGESNEDLTSIKFFRHIRNSVSHSKCAYERENGNYYVIFKDENQKNSSQKCEIKMKTSDVGKMLKFLQREIMNYLNEQWANR